MYFKQKDIFWGMSKAFAKEIMKISVTESHLEGELLFRVGDPAISFYVLLKGRVKLSLGEVGQAVYIVSNAGEAFGWSSLIGRENYTASAEFMAPTKLLKFDREKLQNVLEKDTPIALFYLNVSRKYWAAACYRAIDSYPPYREPRYLLLTAPARLWL